MVKIYVDADACPVRNEVERIATRHKLETYMVCDGGIRPPLNSLIKVIIRPNIPTKTISTSLTSCLI